VTFIITHNISNLSEENGLPIEILELKNDHLIILYDNLDDNIIDNNVIDY
jgi:hypothetical protein